MKKNAPLAEAFVVRDLETLKVIADPLRTQMLEALIREPLTVKQVADKLGLTPSKLYYHINMLEKHGLIQEVETRVVANLIEKVYRAAANDVEIDPALFPLSTDQGHENINTVLAATIDATRDDILRSIQARLFQLEQGAEELPRHIVLARQISFIGEEQATQFRDKLQALLHEFGAADQGTTAQQPDGNTYALTIAFYPSFYFRDSDEDAPESSPAPKGKKRSTRRKTK